MDSKFLKCFKNCLFAESTPEGIVTHRYTPAQYEVYKEPSAFSTRSKCASGVCIDIETDSEFLRFRYTVLGKSKDWIFFDVYINDVFTDHIGYAPVSKDEGIVDIRLGNGKTRVTVYLPTMIHLSIHGIELSEGASFNPAPDYEKNLLCVGDSITQGANAYYPSFSYTTLLARHLGANLLNQAMGGYVFEKGSLDKALPYNPDIITVAYGTNDFRKRESYEAFYEKCDGYLELLNSYYPDAKIYVLTPIWRADKHEESHCGSFERICSTIAQIAEGYGMTVINGNPLVPHMTQFYEDSRLHPNDMGFLVMSLNILKRIDF